MSDLEFAHAVLRRIIELLGPARIDPHEYEPIQAIIAAAIAPLPSAHYTDEILLRAPRTEADVQTLIKAAHLTYGELLTLTEGHGTSAIYERICAALRGRSRENGG